MKENTSDLLNQLNNLDDSVEAFREFSSQHPNKPEFHTLREFLLSYMAEHPDLRQIDVIRNSNLSRDYANQFFNGQRQHPDKYRLIPLCISMGMNLRETNRALMAARQPQLSVHDTRDQALIVCINRGYSIEETNHFLSEYGLETF